MGTKQWMVASAPAGIVIVANWRAAARRQVVA
jgi:hypothetical protein